MLKKLDLLPLVIYTVEHDQVRPPVAQVFDVKSEINSERNKASTYLVILVQLL